MYVFLETLFLAFKIEYEFPFNLINNMLINFFLQIKKG